MEAILTYLSNQSIMIMDYYMYWGEKMSNKATISKRDERLLHTKSGNRCAMCKTILVDVGNPSAACVGENAHIYDSLLNCGAIVLDEISEPQTVSLLWDKSKNHETLANYEKFLLTLDFLYLIGAITIKDGLIVRCKNDSLS